MRKFILFGVLILLIACREDVPAGEGTAVSPTTVAATAVPSQTPTNLPAPAVEETVLESTAVPPTATVSSIAPDSISSIITRLESLEAQFLTSFPHQAGWLYHREELYEITANNESEPATYRGLADTWIQQIWAEVSPEGTILRQVMLVYDTEGGLWERSAILDNTNVRVLPEQTVDGQVIALDKPLLSQTPHQGLINILREIETASFYDYTVTAWEENGRYHVQIDTLFNAQEQSLNGAKMHFVLDLNTGELLQQQNWIVSGAGEETLQLDANWLETAVVPELPLLAAQTLIDAQALLVQPGD